MECEGMAYYGIIQNKKIMISRKPIPNQGVLRFTVKASSLAAAIDYIKEQLPDEHYTNYEII